jgi:Fe-S-cluster containining protein
VTPPRTGPAAYRSLLVRLDAWFDDVRGRHPNVIPCRGGCAACCHGPFDISVADVELLRDAVDRLPPNVQAEVHRRAVAQLERMRQQQPDWTPPYAIADLGDPKFDELSSALAAEPCPLLDEAGRCRIYADRPLVCRLIGLSMRTPAGRVIDNACPIRSQFPAYDILAPQLFDLEDLEAEEMECLLGAARRLFGDASRHDYETTVAGAIALSGSPVTTTADQRSE